LVRTLKYREQITTPIVPRSPTSMKTIDEVGTARYPTARSTRIARAQHAETSPDGFM